MSSARRMANSPIFQVVRWPHSDWQGDISFGRKSWPLASWQQALGCYEEHSLEAGEVIPQPCSFKGAEGSAGHSGRLAERRPHSVSSLLSLALCLLLSLRPLFFLGVKGPVR